MAPFTNVLAIIISIPYLTVAILALGKDNFRKECWDRCSADGPVVRFPFRLNSKAPHCGYHNLLLYCSHNNTVLRLPSSGEYNVTSIDYLYQHLTITRDSWSAPCLFGRNIAMPNVTGSPFQSRFRIRSYSMYVAWLDCSTRITSIPSYAYAYLTGPFSCVGSEGRFVYMADGGLGIEAVPTTCTVINRSFVDIDYSDPKVEIHPRAQLWLYWSDYLINCSACEEKGHQCEFNLETRKSFCSPKGD